MTERNKIVKTYGRPVGSGFRLGALPEIPARALSRVLLLMGVPSRLFHRANCLVAIYAYGWLGGCLKSFGRLVWLAKTKLGCYN